MKHTGEPRSAGGGRATRPIVPRKRLSAITAIFSLAIIGVATLRGGDPTASAGAACFLCLPTGSRVGADVILNVVLFVPYGIALGAMRPGWRWAIGIIVATTLAVELLQGGVVPGRHSSAADIATNTLGGLVGIAFAHRLGRLIHPARDAAGRLAVAAFASWFALIALSALAATPSLPFAAYSVRWRPDGATDRSGEGRVLSTRVDGVALPPSSRAIDDPRLDGLRLGEPTRIDATLIPSDRTDARDVRVEIGTDDRANRIWLGQNGVDLILRVRLRAADARLRSPTLRAEGALDGSRRSAGDDTVSATGVISRDRLALATTAGDRSSATELALGAHLGWGFLVPGRLSLRPLARTVADALWLAFLLAPAAYWARRARVSRVPAGPDGWNDAAAVGVGAILLIVGFAVVPALLGVASIPAPAWAAAVVCLLVGWTGAALSLGAPIFGFSTMRRNLRWMSRRLPP